MRCSNYVMHLLLPNCLKQGSCLKLFLRLSCWYGFVILKSTSKHRGITKVEIPLLISTVPLRGQNQKFLMPFFPATYCLWNNLPHSDFDYTTLESLNFTCSLFTFTKMPPDAFNDTVLHMYSRLSLSRIPRDSLKYFEISVVRHIRFAELRKK